MKLKALLKGLPPLDVRGSKEVEITGINADSRTVAPGNLFIAKKGSVHDGSQFIHQAVASGASVIATDLYDPFLDSVQLIVADPGSIEATLAARYYGEPSQRLLVVGVTGTKGKTTSTYLIAHLLNGLKKKCGLVGSIETVIGEDRFSSSLTTHDVIYNQKILREMVLKGCDAVSFEVSSHGLDQGRVDAIDFDLALFTNLYPDHLDYHVTIEKYAEAKLELFKRSKKIVLNGDSCWAEFMRGEKKSLTFGLKTGVDVRGFDVRLDANGITFWVDFQGKQEKFVSPLIGEFNVYNLLGAIAVGLEMGASLNQISAILSSFSAVPGRLQRIDHTHGIQVFVDHAHAEEPLALALQALRPIGNKRLCVVFGCGGNRDPARRQGMARAAEKWADRVFITNDNPRQESPEEIVRQILSGFENLEKVVVMLDRKQAICEAIASSAPGDIVLVAGKGHEKVQIFAHQTLSFDDVEVCKDAMAL